MSDTIHGYPIIESRPVPTRPGHRPGRIVLVDRERDSGRYVTGWQGDGDHEWISGRYFDSIVDAAIDFKERVERGY